MLTIQELEALRGLVQINVNINLPKGHHMAYDLNRLPITVSPLDRNALVASETEYAYYVDDLTSSGNVDGAEKFLGLYVAANGAAIFTSLTATALKEVGTTGINVSNFPALQSIDFRYLTRCDATLEASSNPVLAGVNLESLSILAGNLILTGGSLPAAQVNALLARLVLCTTNGSTPWAGTGNFTGDNMEAPTGQGLIDKATLVGRGATILDAGEPT